MILETYIKDDKSINTSLIGSVKLNEIACNNSFYLDFSKLSKKQLKMLKETNKLWFVVKEEEDNKKENCSKCETCHECDDFWDSVEENK